MASREESEEQVARLLRLTVHLLQQGRFSEALLPAEQAQSLARSTLGESHPYFASSLNNLASAFSEMGDYPAAAPLYQQALAIKRAALGANHPDCVASLNNLADLYRTMGNFTEAEPLFQEALAIRRAALGEMHPDYALSLNNLAGLYHSQGNDAAAEPLFRQAAEIRKTVLGEDHPDYASSLDNLAGVYQARGDFARAEPLCRQALEIRRNTLGEEHPLFTASLNNLATLHHVRGDYTQAESLFRQALAIDRRTLGEDHPDYALGLNNLAQVYLAMGDFAQAMSLFRQAGEILASALGEDHPLYAQCLNNQAALYHTAGDHAAAEPLFRQALEIRRAVLGRDHPGCAESLNNLAAVCFARRDYAAAEPLYREALAIRRTVQGENHPECAKCVNNIALLAFARGDLAGAEALYREALAIHRTAVGEGHPDYARCLLNLAILYAVTNRAGEALALMSEALASDDRLLGQVFSIGSEQQRLSFLQTIAGNLRLFLSLVLQFHADSPTARQQALDLLFRRKAVAAEALAAQRDAILGGRYPALAEPLQQLVQLRRQIAQKSLAGPAQGEDPAAYRSCLRDWQRQREELEQQLARQVPEMNLEQRLQAADRRAVALALPEGTALVEFVHFEVADFAAIPLTLGGPEGQWKPARYLAFVLPAGEPDGVKMIDLGEAAPIDRLITDFRLAITRDPDELRRAPTLIPDPEDRPAAVKPARHTDPGDALRKAVFDPIAAVLGGCKRLFLAPDGDLSRLPFEVLPTPHGRLLIDDYALSYLSSGRDVLRLGIAPTRPANAALVAADPDFDLADHPVPAPAPKPGFLASMVSWLLSRDFDRAEGAQRLPGTRVEGERIAAMLGVQPHLDVNVLDAHLKTIRSPRILHLATHGFFLRDQDIAPDDKSAARMENPLLRSGLLLAGYNAWREGRPTPKEAEDGVLTAEDVTGMDLIDTELVVLSACETGLGHIHAGEGVFGLRRAFVLAGAKTLVMSLWKVPDEQTQELMVDFYTRILRGEPRAEALRQAQLGIRKKHPHPYFWGAFICQGEPGPLGGLPQ